MHKRSINFQDFIFIFIIFFFSCKATFSVHIIYLFLSSWQRKFIAFYLPSRVKRRLYRRINSSLSIYPQDRQAEINVASRTRRSIKFRSRARARAISFSLYFRVQSTPTPLRRLIEFNLSIHIARVFFSSLAPTRDIASSFAAQCAFVRRARRASISLSLSFLLFVPLHSY